VQAPQVARSQTFLAPVRSRWLRSASSNVTRGSTVSLTGLPLMVRAIGTGPGPTKPDVAGGAACASRPSTLAPIAPLPRPTPRMKRRRETPLSGFLPGPVLELTMLPPFRAGLGWLGQPAWMYLSRIGFFPLRVKWDERGKGPVRLAMAPEEPRVAKHNHSRVRPSVPLAGCHPELCNAPDLAERGRALSGGSVIISYRCC
jgi:hypothetical protein